jgi:hypothetical protein
MQRSAPLQLVSKSRSQVPCSKPSRCLALLLQAFAGALAGPTASSVPRIWNSLLLLASKRKNKKFAQQAPAAPRLRAARAGKRSPTCTPQSVRTATAPAPPSRQHHRAAMQVKPPAEQVPPDLLEQLLGACRPTCCPIQQVHPAESGTTCSNLLTGQKIKRAKRALAR